MLTAPRIRSAIPIALLLLAGPAAGQEPRYELGLRVRALERELEPFIGDIEVRKRVCEPLQAAVSGFFALRPGEVAKQLDRARHLVTSTERPAPEVRWADSLTLRPEARVLDTAAPELKFRLQQTYRSGVPFREGASLVLYLAGERGGSLTRPRKFRFDELPFEGSLPLGRVIAGDHRLVGRIELDHKSLAGFSQTISFVGDLPKRLKVASTLANETSGSSRTATIRGLARTLRALGRKRTLETDMPAKRMFDELERIAATVEKPYGLDRPGDHRVWLRVGRGTVACRLFVPAVADVKQPIPLVVALHGMGGTENLFFDGYGAGKIVGLCKKRGWMLVAPRGGPGGMSGVSGLVDALAEWFPIDRKRVFGVGHSMGAMQLMGAASVEPQAFAAVAAIGGGGRARASEELRALPVMIAPGEQDFALPGARRLFKTLELAGVDKLRFQVYEAAEHLGIVQVALDDVFEFFDANGGGDPKGRGR